MEPANICSEQGCQIFRGTTYQNGKTVPNDPKRYQLVTEYTNIFNSKALQNLPKVGLFKKIYHLATPVRKLEKQCFGGKKMY
jgi:hypothetical protein